MLTLAMPTPALMPFRAAMLADPDTMAYNAPFAPPDGVIAFPESAWDAWLTRWAAPSAERFCAYVLDDGTPVGEVCWHDGGRGMGVVIAAAFRGHGYGTKALALLAEQAFDVYELPRLVNTFEVGRDDAMAMHVHAGFIVADDDDGLATLVLTRETWQARRRDRWVREVYDAMCAYETQVPERIHHFVKVHSFARQIAQHEGFMPEALFTMEIAALTHDIGIKPALATLGNCAGPHQERLGPPEAVALLAPLGLPQAVIDRVCFLIAHHHTVTGVDSPDWQILLEADYLVNMIENGASPAAIDMCRDTVFRTAEGLRLLAQIRP